MDRKIIKFFKQSRLRKMSTLESRLVCKDQGMDKVDPNKLCTLNQRGIFPGPEESDRAFFLRADALLLKSGFSERFQQKFNTCPDWIDVACRSNGLYFWEGAATWIEEGEDGTRSCWIQLKNSPLMRLYPQEEIIAHEMVHATRLMFDEKRFEEILAYQTSQSRFRRYFGPLFSSPAESKGSLVFLSACFLGFWAGIVFEIDHVDTAIGSVFLCAIGFAFLGLYRSQSIFSKTLHNLQKAACQGAPLEVALRLTDREIELFAIYSPEQIRDFANQQTCLRWQQLRLAYF